MFVGGDAPGVPWAGQGMCHPGEPRPVPRGGHGPGTFLCVAGDEQERNERGKGRASSSRTGPILQRAPGSSGSGYWMQPTVSPRLRNSPRPGCRCRCRSTPRRWSGWSRSRSTRRGVMGRGQCPFSPRGPPRWRAGPRAGRGFSSLCMGSSHSIEMFTWRHVKMSGIFQAILARSRLDSDACHEMRWRAHAGLENHRNGRHVARQRVCPFH